MQVAPINVNHTLSSLNYDFFSDFMEIDPKIFMDLDISMSIPAGGEESGKNGYNNINCNYDGNENWIFSNQELEPLSLFPLSLSPESSFSADVASLSSPLPSSPLLSSTPPKPVWSFFNSVHWIPFDEATSQKIENMYDNCDTAYDYVTDSNFQDPIYIQLPDAVVYRNEVKYKIRRTLGLII